MERRFPLLGRASLGLAMACVVVAPLLFGGVHPPVLFGLALAALLALSLHVADRALRGRPLAVSWVSLPLLAGVSWSLLTLVPLPGSLRALVSPKATEDVAWVVELLSNEARDLVRPVLSLDPPETALAVLRLVSALAVFVVVADRCRRREERRLAFRLLLLGAVAVFLVSLGHRLANVTEIWGTFLPNGRPPLRGPLINPNHLARVFGAFSLLCLGRALVVRSRTEALWFALGAVTCGAGVFLTFSRGGALAFVAVLVVVGLAALWRKRSGVPVEGAPSSALGVPTRGVVFAELLGLLALGVALYLAREAFVDEMVTLGEETLETSKARLYPPALRLLSTYPLFGVTNGGLQSVYLSTLEPGELSMSVPYVENLLVQTLVDHGVVVGPLLVGLAAIVAFVLRTTLRSMEHAVALPAALFLVLGDIFDFALEIAAGSLLLWGALALAASHLLDGRRFCVRLRPKGALAAIAGVGCIVAWASVVGLPDARWSTDRQLARTTPDQRLATYERALARHPLDGHFAYSLATEARARKDAGLALKWANRALYLWPSHGPSHVEAARALAAMGHLDQALLEYKLAWVSGNVERGRLLAELALRTDDVEKWKLAVPDEPAARGALCNLLVRQKRIDVARACFDDAARDFPEAGSFLISAAKLSLQLNDGSGAEERLRRMLGDTPPDGEVAALLAQAMLLSSGIEAAYASSTAWLEGAKEPRLLLGWRLSAATRLGRFQEAFETLQALRKRTSDRRALDGLDRKEAELRVRFGQKGEALRLWRQLSRRNPSDVDALVQLARLELELGLLQDARVSYTRAARLDPERPSVKDLGQKIDRALDASARERLEKLDGSR